MSRTHQKLEKVFGGIAQLNRLPNALLILDVSHEHLAVAEADRLGITTFGIVDTNSDPGCVDFAVPANDDASKSIKIVVEYLTSCIKEGLEERNNAKEEKATEEESAS